MSAVFTRNDRAVPPGGTPPLWVVTVPANGTATLRYRVIEDED